jgi:hypothetical protein
MKGTLVAASEWVTDEMFDEKLQQLADRDGAGGALTIGDCYSEIRDHYNNEVLNELESERDQPGTPVGETDFVRAITQRDLDGYERNELTLQQLKDLARDYDVGIQTICEGRFQVSILGKAETRGRNYDDASLTVAIRNAWARRHLDRLLRGVRDETGGEISLCTSAPSGGISGQKKRA